MRTIGFRIFFFFDIDEILLYKYLKKIFCFLPRAAAAPRFLLLLLSVWGYKYTHARALLTCCVNIIISRSHRRRRRRRQCVCAAHKILYYYDVVVWRRKNKPVDFLGKARKNEKERKKENNGKKKKGGFGHLECSCTHTHTDVIYIFVPSVRFFFLTQQISFYFS